MLIRVEYPNHRYDMVQDYYLTALIAERRIRRFRRTEGWVELGRDPVRKGSAHRYGGPERRDAVAHRPLDTPIRIGGQNYYPFPSGQFKPDD